MDPLAATALGIEDLDLGNAADRLFQFSAQPTVRDHHVLRDSLQSSSGVAEREERQRGEDQRGDRHLP